MLGQVAVLDPEDSGVTGGPLLIVSPRADQARLLAWCMQSTLVFGVMRRRALCSAITTAMLAQSFTPSPGFYWACCMYLNINSQLATDTCTRKHIRTWTLIPILTRPVPTMPSLHEGFSFGLDAPRCVKPSSHAADNWHPALERSAPQWLHM